MFWCTESWQAEKARKNARYRARWERERIWHRWFAWRPVGLHDHFEFEASQKAWLCWVERKLEDRDCERQPEFYTWGITQYVYRLPKAATP